MLAVIAPELRHAHRRAQFPRLCLLRPRDCDRADGSTLTVNQMVGPAGGYANRPLQPRDGHLIRTPKGADFKAGRKAVPEG